MEQMAKLPANSVDAIVTDPPYELGFMGKKWDGQGIANSVAMWSEALRVLKPGGYLLSFGGTRTYHRMTCAIEDAGFEIRDCLMWLYGSGFPKSHDVSKAIDKQAGAKRKIIRPRTYEVMVDGVYGKSLNTTKQRSATCEISEPATTQAKQWAGWGTALKPAYEPIVVARKPLEGTVANNVLLHGTGAMNIDASRIGTSGGITHHTSSAGKHRDRWEGNKPTGQVTDNGGRWPANVLLDEEAGRLLDEQSGKSTSKSGGKTGRTGEGMAFGMGTAERTGHDDKGGASRFFYSAKASKKDRGAGNTHPTVKPTELMCYLIKLVTQPGGTVLDPFGGSGTTGVAAMREGFNCILIEREAEYVEIIKSRLAAEGRDS